MKIEISKELENYLNDVIEMLEEDEGSYESLIWNLIKVAEVKGGMKYEQVDNPLYG